MISCVFLPGLWWIYLVTSLGEHGSQRQATWTQRYYRAHQQVAYQAPNLYPKKWGVNQQTWVIDHDLSTNMYMAVCQNLVPLVNIKIAGKWMFIPLKMVLIGIDP